MKRAAGHRHSAVAIAVKLDIKRHLADADLLDLPAAADLEAIQQVLPRTLAWVIFRLLATRDLRQLRVNVVGHAPDQDAIGQKLDLDAAVGCAGKGRCAKGRARLHAKNDLALLASPQRELVAGADAVKGDPQPRSRKAGGMFSLSSIVARRLRLLPAMKKAPSRLAMKASGPPPPGTTLTLRWAMLLSWGTSRHSWIVSVGEKLSILLGSPAAVAMISRQSWP
ncbi:hypothetical protein ACFSYD_22275 [Paracoccus aerius]